MDEEEVEELTRNAPEARETPRRSQLVDTLRKITAC